MYLLGYDIGSSAVKASLVDAQTGRCVATSFYPKSEAAIIAVKPGWAEQEPAFMVGTNHFWAHRENPVFVIEQS